MQNKTSGAASREEDKQWLLLQVNAVLEPMMLEIFSQKPQDNIAFMLQYLERKFGLQALNGRVGELENLKREAKQLEQQLADQQEASDSDKSERSLGSHEDTDEDEEDDYLDDLPEQKTAKSKAPRASVSAEAFGAWNQRKDYKPKFYQKSTESCAAIREKLNNVFMFSCLDEKDKDIVVAAMEEKVTDVKEKVICEGDEGDCLYVVGSGTLLCQKVFKGNTEPTFLKTYQPGEAFGELSLLYNAPRAATIIANEECLLWKLDRETFNHIVKEAANKRRNQYESFLTQVPILSTMEPYERSKLSDAFKEVRVTKGEYIIKEGDAGFDLFLLKEGEAFATKTLSEGTAPQQVMAYSQGDFFGERALIKNEPRAANVIAATDCVLVSLDRHSVKRLLGDMETLLKRNFEIYEKFK